MAQPARRPKGRPRLIKPERGDKQFTITCPGSLVERIDAVRRHMEAQFPGMDYSHNALLRMLIIRGLNDLEVE
jgi:hypothetical protein